MSDEIVYINSEKFKILIPEEEIKRRVKELGQQISRDYAGSTPIFIGVLNGSVIFFADLIREVKIDCEIDFLKLSSYGDEKISSGRVKLLKDLDCQVTGRDIIVVEDIIDSGLSIKFIKNLIMLKNPKSLRIVTLLYKRNRAQVDFDIDYIGFEIGDEFVIGYGLDYAQRGRNLRAIYVIDTQEQ